MKYRYIVTYEKTFLNGILKGKHYSCNHIRFADWKSADEFRARCERKETLQCCHGTGSYMVSDPILSALE